MPVLKQSTDPSQTWRGGDGRRAEWAELMATLDFLPREDRALIARIVQRVAILEMQYGEAVADAMLERAVRLI
jgi:hypothetical protein